jgi:hypothetical protein
VTSIGLHAISVSLTATSLAASVDVVVVAGCAVLVARARRGSAEAAATVSASDLLRRGLRLTGLAALAVLLLAFIWAARRAFGPAPSPPFTQVSFAGRWAKFATAPRLGAERQLLVELEIDNHTHNPQRYRITPALAGRAWPQRDVDVAEGQRWSGYVRGPVPNSPCAQRLVVTVATVPAGKRVTQLALGLRRRGSACAGEPA